jgi:hypothetical protein
MLFESHVAEENSGGKGSRLGPRARLWLSNARIFALTTASTAVLLLCPCDRPGGSARAVLLVAVSTLLGLAAAALVYRRVQSIAGITEFLKVVIAIAVAGLCVYAEFEAAGDVIAWLAQRANPR